MLQTLGSVIFTLCPFWYMSARRPWKGYKPNGIFSFQTEDKARQNLRAFKTGLFNVFCFFFPDLPTNTYETLWFLCHQTYSEVYVKFSLPLLKEIRKKPAPYIMIHFTLKSVRFSGWSGTVLQIEVSWMVHIHFVIKSER